MSVPTGTNSSMLTTNALTSTTRFWVRVRNACASESSRLSQSPSPPLPSAIRHRSSRERRSRSGRRKISHVDRERDRFRAAPLPMVRGNRGDRSHPVGIDHSHFTTPALQASSSYWVSVQNACGQASRPPTRFRANKLVSIRRLLRPSLLWPGHSGQPFQVRWNRVISAGRYRSKRL